jgi:hypothetical protein
MEAAIHGMHTKSRAVLKPGGWDRISRGLGVVNARENNPAAPFNRDEQIFDRFP